MNPNNQQTPTVPGAAPTPPNQPLQQPVGPQAAVPAALNAQQPQVIPQQTSGNIAVNGQVKPAVNPNSTQNALLVAEVRDGIVIMNDGSFRAAVMCKSVNFDLMSPQEREGVEAGYQSFLNSLYFPIQIVVHSRKVDLAPYLEKLDKIRQEHDNMLLSLLMEDYTYFMADLAERTNIMDKMFYVVVDFHNTALSTDNVKKSTKNMFSTIFNFNKTADHVVVDESVLETAKTELRNRVQTVMQGLQQCGVKSLPLDTQELIELFYDSYNPDTATRQQLKNFDDMTSPIVSKGQGRAVDQNLERALQ